MRSIIIKLVVTLFLVMSMGYVKAQDITNSADTVYSIIDSINAKGVIIIEQPDGLVQRLRSDTDIRYSAEKTKAKDRGDEHTRYCIQIFSENKGQSSKKNAEYRKRIVEQRMPGMRGVVVYESPNWRVRVGSFRTESEARAAERELKSKFPSFAGEMRIVRIKI